MLAHSRRKVLHFNVTENAAARWTAQQSIEAFPWRSAPKYVLRERDAIYGGVFQKRLTAPLNVSREILQESRDVEAIRNGASSAPLACSDLAGADQGAAKATLYC
jgi:hypothetical protein